MLDNVRLEILYYATEFILSDRISEAVLGFCPCRRRLQNDGLSGSIACVFRYRRSTGRFPKLPPSRPSPQGLVRAPPRMLPGPRTVSIQLPVCSSQHTVVAGIQMSGFRFYISQMLDRFRRSVGVKQSHADFGPGENPLGVQRRCQP